MSRTGKDNERTAIPWSSVALLTIAGWLVPPERRVTWRRQWEAEIGHRTTRTTRGLVVFTMGAFAHAYWIRREGATMTGFLADVRTAGRALLRRPAFTAVSVLTLGVGIGSATAVFSMAEAVLLRPLDLPESDQLVRLYSTNLPAGVNRFSVSYPDFTDWSGRGDLFSAASFYTGTARDMVAGDEPTRMSGAIVYEGFFETLGTRARLGRLIESQDLRSDADAVVVLSEDAWVRLFGADPSVLGTTVRLDGVPYTVIGVTPRGASWPVRADFWLPLRLEQAPDGLMARSNHSWQVIARLQPQVAPEVAAAQVDAQARAWYSENTAGRDQGIGATVVTLRSTMIGQEAPTAFGVLGAAVLLVLLIACINQSNLLLTHGLARTRELSVRSALGAARSRVLAALLTESVLLSLAGCALGLVLAWTTVRGVVAVSPVDLPALSDVRLNGVVLLGAVAIALLASLAAGLWPARRASRTSVAEALREGSQRAIGGRSSTRSRKALVSLELALSLVLLSATGLAIRTFQAQLAADPGFSTDQALLFSVRLPSTRYGSREQARQFWDESLRRLEALPGVTGAGITSQLPVGATGGGLFRSFLLEGTPEPPAGQDVGANWLTASPGYFSALGLEVSRGRAFTPDDGAGAPPVMVVTESFARRISPDQDVLGRRIQSWRDEKLLREVVGVVADFQLDASTGVRELPAVFVPVAQDTRSSASFFVGTAGRPEALVAPVRAAFVDLDADVALAELRPLSDAREEAVASVRFVMTLLGFFGALALGLALVGVYALISHGVAQRTAEFGVRLAMGATAPHVEARVIGEGLRLAGSGMAIGALASVAVARVAASRLYGVTGVDAPTLVGVTLLLGLAAVLASWIPARRVLRVDPVEALRGGADG